MQKKLDDSRVYTALHDIKSFDQTFIIQNDPILNQRIREVVFHKPHPISNAEDVIIDGSWYESELQYMQSVAIPSSSLPRGTRFYFFKRVIIKLMQPCFRVQEIFNRTVVSLFLRTLKRQHETEMKVMSLENRIKRLEVGVKFWSDNNAES